jgi:hypothetical protein
VQPKELGIPTKAYYAVEEVKEVDSSSFIYKHKYLVGLVILLICMAPSIVVSFNG